MASKASVQKKSLARKIEDQGFIMISSCVRCARLNKNCIKSEDSDRCSECVREGRSRCVESKPSFTDAEWRRLVAVQQKLRDEEDRANEEMFKIMARMNRLRKQEKLLRQRANEFLAHEFKEIEELENLEEQEKIEEERSKDVQKESVGSSVLVADSQLAAVSEGPSLTQMLRDPFFWSNLEMPDGIVEQVGGSLSGSQ